jgi:hypothetical protein
MTQDEIIEMARQAGCPMANMMPMYFTDTQLLVMFEVFAKLVAEKAFKKGFYSGWEESGEGFNSEFGCLKSRVIEMCEIAWEENKKT